MTPDELVEAERRFAENQALYAAIGRALSAWGHVEAELYEFYAEASAMERMVALKTLLAHRNFKEQLKVIDITAQYALADYTDGLLLWQEVKAESNRLSDERNLIAHGNVVSGQISSGEAEANGLSRDGWQELLISPFHKIITEKSSSKMRDREALTQLYGQFNELAGKISRLKFEYSATISGQDGRAQPR